MTIFQSILLGAIQGATEFLPISSSAHLVLTPYLLGWDLPAQEAFVFDVLVQVATLLAVFVYFWGDWKAVAVGFAHDLRQRRPGSHPQARLGWYFILASVPAGASGLLFKDLVQGTFASPNATAMLLLGTALLLSLAERLGRRRRSIEVLSWRDALWIGLFQALALFPGISRSGATITGGMTRDLERPAAARFSFLMSVPIMLAAGLSAALDLTRLPDLSVFLPPLIAGSLAAAAVGYMSIRWLLAFLARRSLYAFAGYCTLLSLFTLITLNF